MRNRVAITLISIGMLAMAGAFGFPMNYRMRRADDPNEFIPFWIGVFGGILMLGGFVLKALDRIEQRGFEVKLNSGDEPETKKKENDHG